MPRQLHHLFQQFPGVHGAGRVVGVDKHDSPGAAGDFLADIVDIREPVLLLVASVVNRLATGQGHGGRPERVVRGRDQHLVAGIEHGLHGHHNHFADAIAQVDIVDIHLVDAPLLAIVHHRLTGGEQPF